ncbi:double-stranded RNA-binding protein 1 isoform X5 [Populus trichocarpa]|uniref:double-stranded RNA-binding protein 1 isoform X5 n=1 Tax=Populus trichocarpa TaxID=3694 RepID=UPI0022776D7C|nr:double-stranded RNA-binding protein 1 isoform X5 [Populus trichocarpa]
MNNKRVMYKSKLQQLSQQRGWEIPKYEVTKEGQEHSPHFYATVTVDATLFSTPFPSSSTKKAQNDAAKLAYKYFSDHPRPSSSSPLNVSADCSGGSAGENTRPSPGGKLELDIQDANPTPLSNEAGAVAKTDESFGGILHLFKNQLQTYAQKRNFTRPVYSCERVGPPHAIRFKCKVTVNGQTYESREYFPTLSKAENAAAKAALMSLLPNGVEEDKSGYKNLLQDMAQREGCGLPTYFTEKSGEAHAPTFISTVEIDGVIFTGKEARTKKQAEMSAAKTAYTARRR